MKIKKCFGCKRKYPLFMYHINHSTYQRESDKGVCIECRICGYKRALENKGWLQRIDGKFTFVKATRKEILINFWWKK